MTIFRTESAGCSIEYLVEDQPLNPGSLQFLPRDLKDPFLVMNGDVLTRLNPSQLLRFHFEHEAVATLAFVNTQLHCLLGCKTNGVELAGFKEKPSYRQLVNAGSRY